MATANTFADLGLRLRQLPRVFIVSSGEPV
jgi:hypothetical protein